MGIFSTKEKARPDFSNVERGSSSTAPAPAILPGPTPSRSETYVVVEGDSLSKIAQRHYGAASKWKKIFEANRDTIKDPDLIYPGQELRIPEAEKA